MKKDFMLIFILSFALLLGACSKKKAISIAGSTTVLPIITLAAEQFKAKHSNINIIVNAGGSGVAVNQLGEKKIDIGMISRDLTEAEIKRYPNIEFVLHTAGKDAVLPVVSSEIYHTGLQMLSLEQIGKIYKGEISNWKKLNGPDRDILVIDKESSRGTRHVFMKSVLGDKEARAPGADLVLGSNNEEQTAIVQSDAAIGMLSKAWLNENVKGLAIVMPDNSVIEPTEENMISSKFPIVRDLYLVTNGEPTGDIKAFIDFILSKEGQSIVEEVGYVCVTK